MQEVQERFAEFSQSFTVLMSVYRNDDSDLFRKAIQSVFNQSLQPSKLLLVCDGPVSVGVEKVLSDALISYADRIQIVRLQQNVGLADALNVGLSYIKSTWVARADADDINRYDRFQKTATLLNKEPNAVLLGGVIQEQTISGEKIAIRVVPSSCKDIKRQISKRNPFNHMTVAFRADVVRSLGGYPNVYLREDYGLWIKLISAGHYAVNHESILVDATTNETFFNRRGGYKYARGEFLLQKMLVQYKLKPLYKAILHGGMRGFIFLLPGVIRRYIYLNFLRQQ